MAGLGKKYNDGFSFIEIMIVLFLFSLITTFAAPQFFAAFEKTNAAELRHLTRVLNLLRNESILGNTRYFIVFNPKEQSYHVELQRKEGGRIMLESPRILRPHTFPDDFQLENIALFGKSVATRTQYNILSTMPEEPVSIQVDSSGFVTPFTLFFQFDDAIWLIQTKNIMGHLEMKVLEDV